MSERSSRVDNRLAELTQAYLANSLDYSEFRGRFLSEWDGASRRALSAAERDAWSHLHTTLRQTSTPAPVGDRGLFTEDRLRELAEACLFDSSRVLSSKEHRARQIQESISAVLMQYWDPIGVKDIPEAADEYDSYVGGVYRLIASGSTAQGLAEHLARIELTRTGTGPIDPARLIPVAERLLALDVSLA